MFRRVSVLLIVPTLLVRPVRAQTQQNANETETLQKAVQNPIASLISIPFQNNTYFPIGSFSRTQNVLNIQPVIPVRASEHWTIIARFILPVISQPNINAPDGGKSGIGDFNPRFFLSPAMPGKVIWGIGPEFSLPTATDSRLGVGKWTAGPVVCVLVQAHKWTVGVLTHNLWSFTGNDNRPHVNSFLFQYLFARNFEKGWYFTSSPMITSDWTLSPNERWIVPLGAGLGRIFKMGTHTFDGEASTFYAVIHPGSFPYAKWQVQLQLALLLPKKS